MVVFLPIVLAACSKSPPADVAVDLRVTVPNIGLKVVTGSSDPLTGSCVHANGKTTCTQDTNINVPPCKPSPAGCPAVNPSVPYGICGINKIPIFHGAKTQFDFTNPNSSHWHVEYSIDDNGSGGTVEWSCLIAGGPYKDLTNFGDFYYAQQQIAQETMPPGIDTNPQPQSGKAFAPWTGFGGDLFDVWTSALHGSQIGATPGIPVSGSTLIFAQPDEDMATRAYSAAQVIDTGTQDLRYGPHPGSTSGWRYDLENTEHEHTLGSASDAWCYLTAVGGLYDEVGDPQEPVSVLVANGSWKVKKQRDANFAQASCIPFDQSP